MFGQKLVEIDCANCGTAFSIPEDLWRRRKADHKSFFCPNGHSNYYPEKKPTEADQLRDQLERAFEKIGKLRQEVRDLRAQLIEEGGTPLPHEVRFSHLLLRNGVYTIEAAKALTEEDLYTFKGIGPARAEQILEAVKTLTHDEVRG
jgi:DNA-directed RNA polymerase alpha subunit